MKHGSQSEVGKIHSILLKHPRDAFISQQSIDAQWHELNYIGCTDYQKALAEYEYFVELLKNNVADIYYLPRHDSTGLDSIYVHDAAIITNLGAILCNMTKSERRGEPKAAGEYLTRIGIPFLGVLSGDGRLEGGDMIWLDERTIVAGQGHRTNAEGIRQLRDLTRDFVDEFVVMPLPHWRGSSEVLHLMSLISPIDHNLAVVYSPLLTVPFRKWLLNRGVKLIDVPDDEFESMGCNILAVAPRKCIMLSGNPRTRKKLEAEGVEVMEFTGREICHKGAGGPTCMTRPIHRLPAT
jgi:arginine deiminase